MDTVYDFGKGDRLIFQELSDVSSNDVSQTGDDVHIVYGNDDDKVILKGMSISQANLSVIGDSALIVEFVDPTDM